MVHTNVLPHVVGLLLWCLVTSSATAQSGSWVLEGWPHDKEGYFAGQTEIVADGARLKITEWPGDEAKDEEALVTYFLGKTVVKVFPWNGERVGLVFEADAPVPAATSDENGTLLLPAPYPARINDESEVRCGEDCVYSVRNVSFQPLDASEFAPGGSLEGTFQPPAEVTLLSKQSFLDRYRIEVPNWTRFDLKDSP